MTDKPHDHSGDKAVSDSLPRKHIERRETPLEKSQQPPTPPPTKPRPRPTMDDSADVKKK